MENATDNLVEAIGIKPDLWELDINSLDIDIRPGSITCIIGPNYSGKSLWLKTLAGIIAPASGTLNLFGEPIHEMEPIELERARLKLAYTSSDTALLSVINGLQNVLLPAQYHHAGDRDLLTQNALKLISDLDFDCDDLEQLPAYMNHVQRFKLAVARALLLDPEVLFIDNPFKPLDAISTESFKYFLLELVRVKKMALVLVTHNVEFTLAHATQVLFITKNEVCCFNSNQELRNSNIPFIKSFMNKQVTH